MIESIINILTILMDNLLYNINELLERALDDC